MSPSRAPKIILGCPNSPARAACLTGHILGLSTLGSQYFSEVAQEPGSAISLLIGRPSYCYCDSGIAPIRQRITLLRCDGCEIIVTVDFIRNLAIITRGSQMTLRLGAPPLPFVG